MARYRMKQKLLALGDDFHIQDEEGRDVFFVDGKALSIGDKLSFQDMNGTELAFIKQKVLRLAATYEIYRNGERVAEVKKELFSLFRDKFEVDVPGPNDYKVEGNIIDHEYRFTRGGETVATVSKQWFSFRDSYGVDIRPGEDDVLILAAAVVIDQASHSGDRD